MNSKQVIAAAAIALLGSSAWAQSEAELQHFGANQPSATRRAEVRAELQSAQALGELVTPSEVLAAGRPVQPSTVARSQVLRDTAQARADLAIPTEVALSAAPAPASAVSRQDVRAEARAYVRSDALRARISSGY